LKEFENILIFGLGLIGGSIAKKLKDSSYSGQVYGFDKDPEILKKGKKSESHSK
jgi:prephenate dehydrogenase